MKKVRELIFIIILNSSPGDGTNFNKDVFFEAFYGFLLPKHYFNLFTNFWSRKPLLKKNKE